MRQTEKIAKKNTFGFIFLTLHEYNMCQFLFASIGTSTESWKYDFTNNWCDVKMDRFHIVTDWISTVIDQIPPSYFSGSLSLSASLFQSLKSEFDCKTYIDTYFRLGAAIFGTTTFGKWQKEDERKISMRVSIRLWVYIFPIRFKCTDHCWRRNEIWLHKSFTNNRFWCENQKQK